MVQSGSALRVWMLLHRFGTMARMTRRRLSLRPWLSSSPATWAPGAIFHCRSSSQEHRGDEQGRQARPLATGHTASALSAVCLSWSLSRCACAHRIFSTFWPTPAQCCHAADPPRLLLPTSAHELWVAACGGVRAVARATRGPLVFFFFTTDAHLLTATHQCSKTISVLLKNKKKQKKNRRN